jgi:hypothetical protein
VGQMAEVSDKICMFFGLVWLFLLRSGSPAPRAVAGSRVGLGSLVVVNCAVRHLNTTAPTDIGRCFY